MEGLGQGYLKYMIRGKKMIFNHNDYLKYELPENWCTETDGDNVLIYNPKGNGAITLSFFNILEPKEVLDERISIMAKKFIDQNGITLQTPLILHNTNEGKTILYGTGIDADNWFIKLWVVAEYPKLVFATYHCEKKSVEVKKCDAIIHSMEFSV